MRGSRQEIANLFSAFADAIGSISDQEFRNLVQGKAKLRLVEVPNPQTPPAEAPCLNEAVAEMAQNLNDAKSREAAKDLLASIQQPRKKQFLLLTARACGVNVTAKDSIKSIEEQLVANVVGAKLRSEAIKKVAF